MTLSLSLSLSLYIYINVCNKSHYSHNKILFFYLLLLVHTYGYTSFNLSLPSLPLYLPHYSLFYHYTSFILFSFLYVNYSSYHFILYKFDIISSIQYIFFPHKKLWVLSLSLSLSLSVSFSLSLGEFLFFLITLIKRLWWAFCVVGLWSLL